VNLRPNNAFTPRWLELLREKTAPHADAFTVQLLRIHLEKLHQIVCSLSIMDELPEELRMVVASILINISDLRQAHRDETWLREHENTMDNGYVLIQGKARIRRSEAPEGICPAPELMGETMQFNPLHQCIATVSAAGECVVMKFTWRDFWARLQECCSEEEQAQVRTALENLAWDHLTRPLEIPPQPMPV